jgi:hypothetical protein
MKKKISIVKKLKLIIATKTSLTIVLLTKIFF